MQKRTQLELDVGDSEESAKNAEHEKVHHGDMDMARSKLCRAYLHTPAF
jgi:hypothetical protein